MLAGSPAAVVAVVQEGKFAGEGTKLCMGVTVILDAVVLIMFTLFSPIASALCPTAADETGFDGIAVAILFAQFALIAIFGFVLGLIIIGILAAPIPRIRICCLHINRQPLKAALIFPLGYLTFVGLEQLEEVTKEAWGRTLSIEPLMVCLLAASFAGHKTNQRRQFANILAKSAPYAFLPFFTLTGASLALNEIVNALQAAFLIWALRALAIFLAVFVCGKTVLKSYLTPTQSSFLWLTYISQAGIALGLALSIKQRFPEWGPEFSTLILSIVVINQLVGPPLCKIGLKLMAEPKVSEASLPGIYHTESNVQAAADNEEPLLSSKTSGRSSRTSRFNFDSEPLPVQNVAEHAAEDDNEVESAYDLAPKVASQPIVSNLSLTRDGSSLNGV